MGLSCFIRDVTKAEKAGKTKLLRIAKGRRRPHCSKFCNQRPLMQSTSGRPRRFYPIALSSLPFSTTDSSELTRACHHVRYIMAETPTLSLRTYDPKHVRMHTRAQSASRFTAPDKTQSSIYETRRKGG